MPLDLSRPRQCLKQFDFETLFIEELGWDRYRANPLEIEVDGVKYTLQPLAEKRGMVAYLCEPDAQGGISSYPTRRKIETKVAKTVHEHIIIYIDSEKNTQIWQWVKRELDKPTACREHTFHKNQLGDALIQKLQTIAFSLSEEENLTITHVAGRARQAFDVDRVTKRFYDRYQKERIDFLKFIKGIEAQADCEWYASLLLNRMMFIYFIQKKGFLDGDRDYLRNHLRMMQARDGKDRFHSFYRHFLLRLFHEGLGQQSRSSELDKLLGKVPFLNGGLFDVHELERNNAHIEVPDAAFEKLFDFFDAYQWHLDERPLRADNEINPDVLGYIFEKYVNQKELGAYYTKEDITEYIAKNTVIPFLFTAAEELYPIAFRPDGSVWKLLQYDPDRYIYEAVRKGVDIPLPEEISVGIRDVPKREKWNQPADAEFALPTETWREHIARRTRCIELRSKLAAGEIRTINDLITYNLDIRQFAQDVIENCEEPKLLRTFYHVIANVTVLDPTCGSGAFLFAALNVLEPLYEACLDGMQAFVDDFNRHGEHDSKEFSDFRKILDQVSQHPNRCYFIFKSIILNNLYGVDILKEACEICKLRLFLKLAAQVEPDISKPNYGLEPLPDIDFNIRAGNTLVGFTTYEEVKKALTAGFTQSSSRFKEALSRIKSEAEITDRAFQTFHGMQTEHGLDDKASAEAKLELRKRLKALEDELNRYLAQEYRVDPVKRGPYEKWLASHKPFHWFAEFYGIMNKGGFDVVIGNPPYVEYGKVKGAYSLLSKYDPYLTNLYSACCFRAEEIKSKTGYTGFIVPVSLPSTDRMQPLRYALSSHGSVHLSSFSTRPSKLFDGTEQRLGIYIQSPTENQTFFTAGYLKWFGKERADLFPSIEYIKTSPLSTRNNIWPKIRGRLHKSVIGKMLQYDSLEASGMLGSDAYLYYKNTGIRYFSTVTLRPPKCWINGKPASSSRETTLGVKSKYIHAIHTLLLSSTFFVFWETMSNCRDLNPSDILLFPTPDLSKGLASLNKLSIEVEDDYVSKGKIIKMHNKLTGVVELESLTPGVSKDIIDNIDRVLSQYYGFTVEELDFIINYDIKYRMGRDAEEESE